jgi:hypothetical protein
MPDSHVGMHAEFRKEMDQIKKDIKQMLRRPFIGNAVKFSVQAGGVTVSGGIVGARRCGLD